MTSPTFNIRLSPSGPEIGTPPAQVGGGAGVTGRVWRFQGTGNGRNVPGTVAGDVAGLEACAVNILPNYKYDIEYVGFVTGTGGPFEATVLGSSDNGLTYPTILVQGPINNGVEADKCYVIRKTNVMNFGTAAIDHVKVQWTRTTSAGSDLTYGPGDCSVVISEWSTT